MSTLKDRVLTWLGRKSAKPRQISKKIYLQTPRSSDGRTGWWMRGVCVDGKQHDSSAFHGDILVNDDDNLLRVPALLVRYRPAEPGQGTSAWGDMFWVGVDGKPFRIGRTYDWDAEFAEFRRAVGERTPTPFDKGLPEPSMLRISYGVYTAETADLIAEAVERGYRVVAPRA